MKSQIARRSFYYLILALLIFSVFAWVAYMLITASMRTDRLEQTMFANAQGISSFLAEHFEARRDTVNREDLSRYLQQLEQLTQLQVWVVDNDYQIVTSDPALGSSELAAISADTGGIIAKAFAGEMTMGSGSPGIMVDQSITVGAPILSGDAKILGVVLLHAPSVYVDELSRSGIGYVLASLAVAFVLVLFMGPKVIMGHARSVDDLVRASGAIAGGDDQVRAHVDRRDELADIAQNINTMADRLASLAASKQYLERTRHQFITDTSEELLGPLANLKNNLLTISREPDDAICGQQAARMIGDIQYLERLIGDLLDLTTLQERTEPLKREPVDLCAAAERVVQAMRAQAEARGVEILHNPMHHMPFIGDEDRLCQMLGIVVDNAIKHAPGGSKVIVGSIERTHAYTWSVVDVGAGIPPEETEYIFDRFYRGAKPENAEGFGLGLAIAREIADQHGIQIEVDSRPGKTEFVFLFPIDPQVGPFGDGVV